MAATPRGAARGVVFCDTSILIAAMYEPHAMHARSRAVVEGLTPRRGACALHALAECYAVLTRMPGAGPGLAPEDVRMAVALVRGALTVVSLTAADYDVVLDDVAARRLMGGLVYDALTLRCAVRARADVIYSWNARQLQGVAPALAGRIRVPG